MRVIGIIGIVIGALGLFVNLISPERVLYTTLTMWVIILAAGVIAYGLGAIIEELRKADRTIHSPASTHFCDFAKWGWSL
jgi:FtsH-binding integral membrane protein